MGVGHTSDWTSVCVSCIWVVDLVFLFFSHPRDCFAIEGCSRHSYTIIVPLVSLFGSFLYVLSSQLLWHSLPLNYDVVEIFSLPLWSTLGSNIV